MSTTAIPATMDSDLATVTKERDELKQQLAATKKELAAANLTISVIAEIADSGWNPNSKVVIEKPAPSPFDNFKSLCFPTDPVP